MKNFSMSDNDLQLLKAVRPFMSGKSQKLLDVLITTINVFRPQQADQKINFDALNTLMIMVEESVESKKNAEVIEVNEYQHVSPEKSENVENLLNLLAEK